MTSSPTPPKKNTSSQHANDWHPSNQPAPAARFPHWPGVAWRSPDCPGAGDTDDLDSQTSTVRTAFLVLDFAAYIVENFSHDAAVAERASSALASAWAAGLPVIHVAPAGMRDQIHPALAPAGDEPVLSKTTM
jgi:hypothetical protein